MSILDARPDACFRKGVCVCGREDWLRSDNDLCYECLHGGEMETTALVPRIEAETKQHAAALAEYLSPGVQAMVIGDDEELQLVAHIINDIKARAKDLEARERAVTAPILQGVETYRAMFRPLRQGFAQARELFDHKVRQFNAGRAAAARDAQAALQEAVDTGDQVGAYEALVQLQPAQRTTGLVVQEAWDFEERNHDIVPTALTVLSRAAVLAEVKRQLAAGETEPAIPGLRLFKREIVKAVGR